MKKCLSALLCLLLCLSFAAAFAEPLPEASAAPEEELIPIVLGEGERSFDFTVTDAEGTTTLYTICTDCETVGAALLSLELIAGEAGPWGLYVKEVQGIHLDYAVDGKYWAFYENDEYALAGVDLTPITEGSSYAFRAE